MSRYQPCKYWDSGHCYNPALRNGLPSLACVGSDRCNEYKVNKRIDNIGQNGNDGVHYLVETIARIICGVNSDATLAGKNNGKKRWQLHIGQALACIEEVRNVDS